MEGTIRITPEELRSAATYLEQKLSAIKEESEQLKSKLDEIGGNWEGAARTAFFDIFNDEMWPVFNQKLPELITGIEKQLTETARVMEETDSNIASKLRG